MFSSFIIYALSVFITFRAEVNHKKQHYSYLKLFSIIFWGYSIYQSFYIEIPLICGIISIFLYTYSIIIFFWAQETVGKKFLSLAFSNDTPNKLIRSGPFSFVRNPFYSAYTITYFITTLILNNPISTILFFILFILYITAIIQEEKKFEKSNLKKEYEVYLKEVKRLIPFVW